MKLLKCSLTMLTPRVICRLGDRVLLVTTHILMYEAVISRRVMLQLKMLTLQTLIIQNNQ